MDNSSSTRGGAGLRLLSQAQLEQLHSATLEVMQRTGISVLSEEARALLRKGGARVDADRVRFPPQLVEWALDVAPKDFTLCSRDGKPKLAVRDGMTYFGTGSDTHNIIDLADGRRRKTVKADIADVARLSDGLANVDFVMCMGTASDVPSAVSDLHHFEAMVSNTTKPVFFTAWTVDNLKTILEMAEAIAGGADSLRRNPFIMLYAESYPPLQMGAEATDKYLEMIGRGLPCIWTEGAMPGATAPVTLAGSVASANAESLAGLTLAQLKREGAPIVYGVTADPIDMASMVCLYTAPESLITLCASTELAHMYHLPCWHYGMCSDSKLFDQQAGIEGMFMTLVAALNGATLCHDVGYIESGLTTSYEMLVAGDEAVGMVRRLMQGIEISDETMALDLIDKVGPGRSYLAEEHTYRHFKEYWRPKLLDRGTLAAWQRKGGTSLGDRARERAKQILTTHSPDPLPGDVLSRLRSIVERASELADSADRHQP